jgi:hypothetical protein
VPNPKTHQVIACELLAGQAIAGCFIHLPGPGEVLAGDPFSAEVKGTSLRNTTFD